MEPERRRLGWGTWGSSGCLPQGLVSVAPHPSGSVSPQALFALCSLLRHFPYAQQQFLKLGGLQVLRSLVQEKGMEVLAVRVVTLLYDLVTEKVRAWGLASPALCFVCACGHLTSPSPSIFHLSLHPHGGVT